MGELPSWVHAEVVAWFRDRRSGDLIIRTREGKEPLVLIGSEIKGRPGLVEGEIVRCPTCSIESAVAFDQGRRARCGRCGTVVLDLEVRRRP